MQLDLRSGNAVSRVLVSTANVNILSTSLKRLQSVRMHYVVSFLQSLHHSCLGVAPDVLPFARERRKEDYMQNNLGNGASLLGLTFRTEFGNFVVARRRINAARNGRENSLCAQ